ncbi:protein of unknown function DUF362 [hydrothermal vent metagenome]|uniref:DUF362 domain-containing protein n=1 Tax=hydrothermal vent metagenome TaxID=652676 RepID=A0A3B1CF10_9ZZZZ
MTGSDLGSKSVALVHAGDYDRDILANALDKTLASISFEVPRRAKVLVKPNWISIKNARLSCTHPQFIRAVCQYFLDRGAKVTVGDSPAFGSALKVAQKSGAMEALADLNVPIIDFKSGPKLDLSFGKSVRLARQPAEADLIVNLPKLKAHIQVGVTAGVKNFFGCVVGIKKALIHSKYGDVKNHFESVVTEVMQALQPSVTILDGIEAMSKTGPVDGEPVRMNIVAASKNPVALDTAIYSLLEMSPSSLPLWREAKARHLPGADLEEIVFSLGKLDQFDASGFTPPASLAPLTFSPPKVALGALKRLWRRIA